EYAARGYPRKPVFGRLRSEIAQRDSRRADDRTAAARGKSSRLDSGPPGFDRGWSRRNVRRPKNTARGVEDPCRTRFEAVFGAQQLPVKTRTAPGIRGMPSAPARTSGGSRPRSACPATDESARQGGVPDLEGTRGIHPHRPRRGASRPAVVVAPDD